jgi:hypothetical protein
MPRMSSFTTFLAGSRTLAAGAALALAASPCLATTIVPAHFAPRDSASAVTFIVGDAATAPITYRQIGEPIVRGGGPIEIRAIDADGTELARRSFTFAADESGVLILAGSGTEMAPFGLTWSADHNAPLHADEFTDQVVHVAWLGRNSTLNTRLACGNGVDVQRVHFGDGTLDAGVSVQRSHRGESALVECTYSVLGRREPVSTTFTPAAASRIRLFLIGDDERAPLEVLAWRQAIETPVQTIAPSVGVEGMWYDPTTPGLGVSIAFDPEAPPEAQVQAVFYGVDRDGRPSWNLIAAERGTTRGLSVYAFVPAPISGLRVDGSAPERVRLTTAGTIEFHSCDRATLRLGSVEASAFYAFVPPRDTIRLVKLLPGDGCSNPDRG